MQTNPAAEPNILSELMDVYQAVKDLASRLQGACEKIEADMILGGKAAPIVRLLHSVLRTRIQLTEKIERRQKAVDGGKRTVNGTVTPRIFAPSEHDSFNIGKRVASKPSREQPLPHALSPGDPSSTTGEEQTAASPSSLNRRERRRLERMNKKRTGEA